jgi:hypothetical protein
MTVIGLLFSNPYSLNNPYQPNKNQIITNRNITKKTRKILN